MVREVIMNHFCVYGKYTGHERACVTHLVFCMPDLELEIRGRQAAALLTYAINRRNMSIYSRLCRTEQVQRDAPVLMLLWSVFTQK